MSDAHEQLVQQFAAEFWFGSPADFFDKLDPDSKSVFLQQIQSNNLQALAYYALNERLPEAERSAFASVYQHKGAMTFRAMALFRELNQLFQAEQIRFAPIKGVDMVRRFYPAGALRIFCDFDILFHPDDCVRALEVLQKNGWVPAGKVDLAEKHHHYTAHCKNGIVIEPHWTMSYFNNVNTHAIWEEITPEAPGSMLHILSAELNILQLCRHAAANDYTHLPQLKFLQDAAAIISNSQIDWQKVRCLSEKWQMPYPGKILGAWERFFPAAVIENMQCDESVTEKFRQLFSCNMQHGSAGSSEWAVNRAGVNKGSLILQALKHMTPGALFGKYHLTGWWRWLLLPGIFGVDLLSKGHRLVKYILNPNKKIRRYQQLVDDLEKSHEK